MSYVNRMWAAGGVAAVNGLSDQGQKIKSGFRSLNYDKQRFFSGSPDAAELRPLSAVMSSDLVDGLRRGDGEKEKAEESLRHVMYLNCWSQS